MKYIGRAVFRVTHPPPTPPREVNRAGTLIDGFRLRRWRLIGRLLPFSCSHCVCGNLSAAARSRDNVISSRFRRGHSSERCTGATSVRGSAVIVDDPSQLQPGQKKINRLIFIQMLPYYGGEKKKKKKSHFNFDSLHLIHSHIFSLSGLPAPPSFSVHERDFRVRSRGDFCSPSSKFLFFNSKWI